MKAPPPRPDAIAGLQRRAAASYEAGRLADALAACREILRIAPDRVDVLGFAGMVAAQAGALEPATEFCERVIAHRPRSAEAHFNLGCVLDQRERLDDAMAAYRRAIALQPGLAPAHHNLGYALQSRGRLDEAASAYRRVIELTPDAAESHRNLGICLQRSGRLLDAARAFGRACALNREWPAPFNGLVMTLIGQGDPTAAIEVCDEWLRHGGIRTEALAFKCAALNDAGDRAGLAYLLDFDRFVKEIYPETPPGYASLAEFNQALARHVSEHPSLRVPPRDHPTYHHPNLRITDELLAEPKGPMADLEKVMYRAVEQYLDELADDAHHPFVQDKPRRWRLTSWGTHIRDQGNLVPHIHLGGYMGGVYYPDLPDLVGDPDQGHAGWFELGRPPPEMNCRADATVRAVQPVEGKMLLFPGYFYHRTIPFTSPQRRISIAFDVI